MPMESHTPGCTQPFERMFFLQTYTYVHSYRHNKYNTQQQQRQQQQQNNQAAATTMTTI